MYPKNGYKMATKWIHLAKKWIQIGNKLPTAFGCGKTIIRVSSGGFSAVSAMRSTTFSEIQIHPWTYTIAAETQKGPFL
jgi:hypothetical protein